MRPGDADLCTLALILSVPGWCVNVYVCVGLGRCVNLRDQSRSYLQLSHNPFIA